MHPETARFAYERSGILSHFGGRRCDRTDLVPHRRDPCRRLERLRRRDVPEFGRRLR